MDNFADTYNSIAEAKVAARREYSASCPDRCPLKTDPDDSSACKVPKFFTALPANVLPRCSDFGCTCGLSREQAGAAATRALLRQKLVAIFSRPRWRVFIPRR
eukprot:4812386-Pyramimonas_sp.AAC.2